MDADSELLTGINVLPANGNEGGDAAYLIAQEEAAHGNDVEGISIDGAGYRGTVLRELTDPAGLNLEVFTPPTERIPLTVFNSEEFTLSADQQTLTCPAGQTTTQTCSQAWTPVPRPLRSLPRPRRRIDGRCT